MRRLFLSGVVAALFAPLALPLAAQAATSSETITTTKVYTSADGVAIHSSGTAVTFTFSGKSRRALKAWRGRFVQVACMQAPSQSAFPYDDGIEAQLFRLRTRATKVRTVVDEGTRNDLCVASGTVRTGKSKGVVHRTRYLVPVGITSAGITAVAESDIAENITIAFEVIRTLSQNGRAPTIDTAVAAFTRGNPKAGPRFVALSGPEATPVTVGDIGYWSDGAQHAVVAALSPIGRRLFMEVDINGVVRSNVRELAGLVDNTLLLD
jgi:hypothetical protein